MLEQRNKTDFNHGEQKSRFMRNPGEFFWDALRDPNVIHILAAVQDDYDPAGVECEEYRAVCGAESQSWAMPIGGVRSAQFGTLEEGLKSGAKLCEECFPRQQNSR